VNVLLVEDEEELANVFARNLRARGHAAVIVSTVEDAMDAIARQHPDVLLLDIALPDGSGWDVLRRLHAAERERLRVIAISASPISHKRIEEFRPDATLEKPFPVDALIRVLEQPGGSEEAL
jgi:DNA-binding response OmpR family regulator